jgi:heptosyltransferase II
MTNNLLICGTNWLGDSVMSMPAIRLLKRRNPSARITILVKPRLADFWKMQSLVDSVIRLNAGLGETLAMAGSIRKLGFGAAYVFPNSFRSAVIPFLAGVPARTGMRGHFRALMLTRVVEPPAVPQKIHQSWEYLEIVGESGVAEVEQPKLDIPSELGAQMAQRFTLGSAELIGLIPGAARGPSKRWSEDRFIEVGKGLALTRECRLLVFGSGNETELCETVASGIGRRALNLAGQTSLPELAALLARCRVVICNDSGGMHLAAAAGAKVVAVFGMTDPAKTGPMGKGHRLICAEGVQQSRDIKRDSHEAAAALKSISADRVAAAARELLV